MADILQTIERYRALGIDQQIDYKKFYLYSIITHSTAIEGSTVTQIENQLLFDEGITAPGRTLQEQMMNLDLKAAYEEAQRQVILGIIHRFVVEHVVEGVVEAGVEIPSALSIAKQIDTSSRTVQRELAYLQAQGIIRRVGADFSGHWEIIEK